MELTGQQADTTCPQPKKRLSKDSPFVITEPDGPSMKDAILDFSKQLIQNQRIRFVAS